MVDYRVRRAAGEFVPARSASKCVSGLTRWRFVLVFGQTLICCLPCGPSAGFVAIDNAEEASCVPQTRFVDEVK